MVHLGCEEGEAGTGHGADDGCDGERGGGNGEVCVCSSVSRGISYCYIQRHVRDLEGRTHTNGIVCQAHLRQEKARRDVRLENIT